MAATLKAAKKRGVVTYKSPMLLKGAHDNVMVNLVDTSPVGESKSTDDGENGPVDEDKKQKRKEAKAKLFAALSEE